MIYMLTVTQRCKRNPLSGSTVNSQVSLLLFFSNIIGSKYENGLPCDLFFAETQTRPQGLYHFRQNVQVPQKFGRFPRNFAEMFRLQKTLSSTKLDKKPGILRCECMETIIHFRKNMMTHYHFIIKKNKRADTRSRKPNNESFLVANIL